MQDTVGRTLVCGHLCDHLTHRRHHAPQVAHISLLVKERVAGRARPLELLQVEADNVSTQVIRECHSSIYYVDSCHRHMNRDTLLRPSRQLQVFNLPLYHERASDRMHTVFHTMM